MKTIILRVKVPDGVPFEFGHFDIGYYETEDKYVSVHCPIKIVTVPTDEEILDYSLDTTPEDYQKWADIWIEGAKWMRSQIFGEDSEEICPECRKPVSEHKHNCSERIKP